MLELLLALGGLNRGGAEHCVPQPFACQKLGPRVGNNGVEGSLGTLPPFPSPVLLTYSSLPLSLPFSVPFIISSLNLYVFWSLSISAFPSLFIVSPSSLPPPDIHSPSHIFLHSSPSVPTNVCIAHTLLSFLLYFYCTFSMFKYACIHKYHHMIVLESPKAFSTVKC